MVSDLNSVTLEGKIGKNIYGHLIVVKEGGYFCTGGNVVGNLLDQKFKKWSLVDLIGKRIKITLEVDS